MTILIFMQLSVKVDFHAVSCAFSKLSNLELMIVKSVKKAFKSIQSCLSNSSNRPSLNGIQINRELAQMSIHII